MAIAVATLAHVPYEIGDIGPPKVYNAPPIFAYNWNAARVTTATSASTAGRTKISFTLSAAGDTIFLPFNQNQVHSVHLSTAAIAAAGVTGFITANMSGCRLYIDKVVGTNDLVIYHANALATGPYPEAANPLNLDKATVARVQALDTQHTNARAYWTTPAPGPALNLVAVDGLGVAVYYTSAVKAVQAQLAAGRTNVEFFGGVAVIGELTPGGWQIHWQTYGDTMYTGQTMLNLNMQVLATGQLHT